MAGLAEMSVEFAPRRFTVCLISREEDDAAVVGWGLEFDDEVLVYLPGCECPNAGSSFIRLSSVERVRRCMGRGKDVRLVWIDSEPAVSE